MRAFYRYLLLVHRAYFKNFLLSSTISHKEIIIIMCPGTWGHGRMGHGVQGSFINQEEAL
jgi:hypothetical protein